ncbi:MAG: autotransporter outer membrane beta-barrel domain-containing protein [Pseudomonadota bacterium]|nr:autotransporter outer membrane beta-barrel domain-containing protein [Pseudomonadota bacterium]
MKKYFISSLLIGVMLSGMQAFASEWFVEEGDESSYPPDENGNIFWVKEKSSLINYGNFNVGAGNIFHMDTRASEHGNLSGSEVFNYGTMATDGTGHAVYFYALPNQRATTTVYNYGDMYRINLGETGKNVASFIGNGSQIKNYQGGIIRGSVLLGTNATLENWGQMLALDTDEKESRYSLNNLIYMDKNGKIKNGFKETERTDRIWVDLTPSAKITTDNIVFGQSGTLYNAGTIDNQMITAFDATENEYQRGVQIYLMNNPYYETDEVVLKDDGSIDREKSHLKYFVEKQKEDDKSKVKTVVEKPILRTHTISLGDDAIFRADQGSEIAVYETLTAQKNANINIGADYYWKSGLYQNPTTKETFNWDRNVVVGVEQSEEIECEEKVPTGETDEDGNPTSTTIHRTKYIVGEVTPEERSLNAIPLRSTAMISEIKTGENAKITIKNTDMTGKFYDFTDNTSVNVIGSSVALSHSEGMENSGQLNFAKNGNLNISGYWQDKISYSDDQTKLKIDTDPPPCPSGVTCVKPDEYVESVYPEGPVASTVRVENNLTMADNAKITLTGIKSPDPYTEMGNRSDVVGWWISGGNGESDEGDTYGPVPDAAIYLGKDLLLGNNSTITFGGGHLRSVDGAIRYSEQDQDLSRGILGTYEFAGIGNSNVVLGDHSTIQTVDQTTNIMALNSVKFGDYGTYKTSAPWDTTGGRRASMITFLNEKMNFENDGYFWGYSGVFAAKQLNMKDRAEVHVLNDLVTETVVGTDSNVYIHAAVGRGGSNGIANGLFRQEGAENITLYSEALNLNEPDDPKPIYNENYVLNGVDVDDIYIQSGGLRLGPEDAYKTDATQEEYVGDIHGTIHMNSDTWVRFTGNKVKIYDPIERNGGATNTMVWIDLDDEGKVDTRNIIDSDIVMIGGGTLNVYHEVTAPKVILDDAGSLRVFDTDLIQADVMEYETAAANTTLFIAPKKNEMDSFGTMQLDRLVIENGSFNAYHPIVASAGVNDVKTTWEGIWLGTNAAINAYNDVRTSKLIRRQETEFQPVTNTTARLMKGQLIVDQHVDVDNLILKSGTFNFKNAGNLDTEGIERDMVVANDVVAESGVDFIVDGKNHPNSGKVIIGDGSGNLTIAKGARIALSNTNLAQSDEQGQMNINANLALNSGSTLDLRTSDAGSDLISATGAVTLGDSIRLIVRNMQEATPYHLISAAGGINMPENFKTSFRWHDTVLEADDGHNLNLTVGHITTLKEELENANVSKNIRAVGGYISDNWDGSYGAWDDIFYATTLNDAVKAVRDYVPDGYIAAPQVALRIGNSFQNVMAGELGDMRRLYAVGSQRTRIAPSMQDRRPVYRGRAGGDRERYGERPMYQPYVRGRYQAYTPDYSGRSSLNIQKRGSYRTNKGGLWAKPFYVTSTQKEDKGISGYDYDAYGLTVGLDHRFGRWTWGLAGLYAQGDFEQKGGAIESDVDTWGIGIYGNFKSRKSGFFTDVFASYVQNKNKATHKIQLAGTRLKANYDTDSLGAGIAFGYDFALAKSLYLTPKIGFNYTHLSSDEIKEKGDAPLVMKVKNPNVDSLQLPVELRVAFPVVAKRFELLPELHVRYTHDFGDTEYEAKVYPNGESEAIKLDNVGVPENLFTVGGGMSYISGAHELSGYYDYDFGDGLTSHIFNVGYKFLF